MSDQKESISIKDAVRNAIADNEKIATDPDARGRFERDMAAIALDTRIENDKSVTDTPAEIIANLGPADRKAVAAIGAALKPLPLGGEARNEKIMEIERGIVADLNKIPGVKNTGEPTDMKMKSRDYYRATYAIAALEAFKSVEVPSGTSVMPLSTTRDFYSGVAQQIKKHIK